MTDTITPAAVEVTQADREAVQAFHRQRLNKLMEAIKDEKAGERLGEDDGDAGDLVQAFARHRLAAIPAGFKLVPVEPTEAMIEAGMDYDERELEIKLGRLPTVEECQAGEWSAMLAAAPNPGDEA